MKVITHTIELLDCCSNQYNRLTPSPQKITKPDLTAALLRFFTIGTYYYTSQYSYSYYHQKAWSYYKLDDSEVSKYKILVSSGLFPI